jgi:zinc transport system substrate-binding protein
MKHTVLFLFIILLISCGPRQKNQESDHTETHLVTAVNYPLFYFAQRIGGDLISVEFPAPSDVDPAYWVPDDESLDIYQRSDLILANGADYARWMHNVSLPSSRIFNTSSQVADRYIELTEAASHSHGPEGEHVHAGYAFTTWLDFQIAIAQAEAVKVALTSLLPGKLEQLEANYQALEGELLELHAGMQEVSRQSEGKHLIGSHPVYQYLSKAYFLDIRSVHFEPGELPSEDQWKEFDELLEDHPSRLMLWEGEPLPEVKAVLLQKGILVMVFNPCGNRPAEGDFMDVMKTNIQTLRGALYH